MTLGTLYSQSLDNIRFKKDGTFKIVQLTDIHWDNTSQNSDKTRHTIISILQKEKPDIIILTGDVVSDPPIVEGWNAIAQIMEEVKIPWIAVLGNHDTEDSRGYSRSDIISLIEKYPYYIQVDNIYSTYPGNYSLPVYSSQKDSVVSILYCIDSNDYPANKKVGHYDWIHFDQISWYRQTNDYYKKENKNNILPSMAFFHIPLVEYNNIVGKNTTIGTKGEGISCAAVNSGLFASMVDKGDVIGVFTGHDHNNDFIGIEKDIALGFGRATGTDAYGNLERGGRVIVLYEGQNKFDTWISTPSKEELFYYYPSGISSIDENTMTFLPAKEIDIHENGINYKYYEGKFKSVEDITNIKPLRTGILNNYSIESADIEDYFGFEFNAYIKISEKGVYRFYTNSDDGSRLYINGNLVVDNDGSHNLRRVDGKVALEKGFHEITVRYFESYMGQDLQVGFCNRNIEEQLIPDEILFIKK